jgi:hydrogenase maturation protease
VKALVAGIGNIFMGDDGFGCEVARRLSGLQLPEGVDVVDFGIRGIDLGYALTDGYDLAVLIDAMDSGAAPGSVSVIEPRIEAASDGECEVDAHSMDPAQVLRLIASLRERAPRLLMVTCVPDTLGGDEGHLGLSECASAAVDTAVNEVRTILEQWHVEHSLRNRTTNAGSSDVNSLSDQEFSTKG